MILIEPPVALPGTFPGELPTLPINSVGPGTSIFRVASQVPVSSKQILNIFVPLGTVTPSGLVQRKLRALVLFENAEAFKPARL